jgi:shikimate dehydrogenase
VSYTQAESLAAQCLLIVNTTPAGMFPLTNASPWTHFEVITPQHLCYDLIYNPSETLFMQQAKAHGAQTIGGLDMLHRQAALSWDIWQK